MQRVARYANDVVVSLEKLMSALELNLIGCQLYYLVGRVAGGICVCGGGPLPFVAPGTGINPGIAEVTQTQTQHWMY